MIINIAPLHTWHNASKLAPDHQFFLHDDVADQNRARTVVGGVHGREEARSADRVDEFTLDAVYNVIER